MSKNVWKWNKLIIIGLDREEENLSLMIRASNV